MMVYFESCPCCGSNEFIYRIIGASDMEFAQVTVTCAKCERRKHFYYNKKNVCYEEIVADWNKWVGERAGCAVPV